jgi:hypothetical protein
MRVTFGDFDTSRSYALVALQQGRVALDSDHNESDEVSSRKDPFSLGIAAMPDCFEFAKPENEIFRFLYDSWKNR